MAKRVPKWRRTGDKSEFVQLRISREQKARIVEAAKERKLTITSLILSSVQSWSGVDLDMGENITWQYRRRA